MGQLFEGFTLTAPDGFVVLVVAIGGGTADEKQGKKQPQQARREHIGSMISRRTV